MTDLLLLLLKKLLNTQQLTSNPHTDSKHELMFSRLQSRLHRRFISVSTPTDETYKIRNGVEMTASCCTLNQNAAGINLSRRTLGPAFHYSSLQTVIQSNCKVPVFVSHPLTQPGGRKVRLVAADNWLCPVSNVQIRDKEVGQSAPHRKLLSTT